MDNENELKQIWEEYINSQKIYRIVSEDYISEIKKNGFQPNQNHFNEIKPQLLELFNIVLNLKNKGFLMMRWWENPVDQEVVVNCTKTDLEKNYIDFTPNFEKTIDYYLNLKGGALVQTILIFTEELLLKIPQILSKKELKLVTMLNEWSRKKANSKNIVISLSASSSYFEKVIFQIPNEQKYLESPFGSFENFKKIINKNGLDAYLPYLKFEKLFYLRTKISIPPSEIIEIIRK